MGRLGRRAEGGERQIADVKVALELGPGKTFAIVVDGDGLAEQRLGFERSVGGWRTPERRARLDDLHRASLDVARRRDEAAQAGRCEIGTDGRDSAVEGFGGMFSVVTRRPN